MQALALVFGIVSAWVGSALIARLILSFGVGILTFVGISALLDSASSAIGSLFASVPSQMVDVVGTMRIDDAVKVVLSACAIRLTMSTLKRITFSGPPVGP